jgi:glutathione S-transferase
VVLKGLPDLLTPYPYVKAWFDRLVALPAFQELAKEQQAVLASFVAKQQETK